MTRCESCAAARICPAAFTRWALQCEAFTGPTVTPVTDALDAAFWQMVAEDMAAAEDHRDEMETAHAAHRGVL